MGKNSICGVERWRFVIVRGTVQGMLFFRLEEEPLCFVGDVIFAGSVGRADLPGGDFDALERSIRQQVHIAREYPDSPGTWAGYLGGGGDAIESIRSALTEKLAG